MSGDPLVSGVDMEPDVPGEPLARVEQGRDARVQLSDLDWAILNQLTHEPHLTARAIADNLGTTATQVVARLRKLDRKKAFHVMAALDLKALGQSFCFVFVEVKGSPVAVVAEHVCAMPEVLMACSLIGHGSSLVLAVRFVDQVQLMDILYRKLAQVPGIYRLETSTVLDAPVFHALYMDFVSNSLLGDTEKLKSDIRANYSEDIIDDTDATIIAELQQDGRRSIRSVARRSGLNAGTVRYRIRSLEARGLIHFVTLLNPQVASYRHNALLIMDVDVNALDEIIASLSGQRWLPQLFVCAGASSLIGIVLAESMQSLVEIKCNEVDPIVGVVRAQMLPLIQVYRMDARWAQRAKQQI